MIEKREELGFEPRMTLPMLDAFAARLGHSFNNSALLEQALTHSSFHFENPTLSTGHFERLEFLGDAVLDLVLSEILMSRDPGASEGVLSKWRASLVNEATLAEVARELELGSHLRLGRSEVNNRDNLRPRLLASAFEAVIGALYLDGHLPQVRQLIEKIFGERVRALDVNNEFAADAKTRLQEWTQAKFHCVPEYRLVHTEGPDHQKSFTCEVLIHQRRVGMGTGPSRKSAEQEAARAALNTEVGK